MHCVRASVFCEDLVDDMFADCDQGIYWRNSVGVSVLSPFRTLSDISHQSLKFHWSLHELITLKTMPGLPGFGLYAKRLCLPSLGPVKAGNRTTAVPKRSLRQTFLRLKQNPIWGRRRIHSHNIFLQAKELLSKIRLT